MGFHTRRRLGGRVVELTHHLAPLEPHSVFEADERKAGKHGRLGRRANSDEGEARSTAGDGRSEGREGRRHLRADGPAVCRVEAELSLTDRQQLDAEVRLNVLLVGIEHPPPQRVPRRCRSRQGASGTDVVVRREAGGERRWSAPQK